MNPRSLIAFVVGLATFAGVSVRAAETTSAALFVRGEVDKPLQFSLADFQAIPRSTGKAREKDGAEVTFQGVALIELIGGNRGNVSIG